MQKKFNRDDADKKYNCVAVIKQINRFYILQKIEKLNWLETFAGVVFKRFIKICSKVNENFYQGKSYFTLLVYYFFHIYPQSILKMLIKKFEIFFLIVKIIFNIV